MTECNTDILTEKGQAFSKEFSIGLENAGGLMTELIECNTDIPTEKGLTSNKEFHIGLETAG